MDQELRRPSRARFSDDNADLALLERVANGDRDALRDLYGIYYHPLLRFIYRITGRLDLAQEGVNDVMLVVWRSSRSFGRRSMVSTWIMGIAYRKALKLSPQYLDIKNKLGSAYCEMGLLQDAEAQLEEALAQNPHYVDARITLGVVLLRSGRAARAREEWEKCLALSPTDVRARAYLDLLDRDVSSEETRAQ